MNCRGTTLIKCSTGLHITPTFCFMWTYVLWKRCIHFLTICVNHPVTKRERKCQGLRWRVSNTFQFSSVLGAPAPCLSKNCKSPQIYSDSEAIWMLWVLLSDRNNSCIRSNAKSLCKIKLLPTQTPACTSEKWKLGEISHVTVTCAHECQPRQMFHWPAKQDEWCPDSDTGQDGSKCRDKRQECNKLQLYHK